MPWATPPGGGSEDTRALGGVKDDGGIAIECMTRGLTDGAWDHSSAVEDGLASAAVDGAIDGSEGAGGASDGGRASGGLGGGERERLSHCSSCCCCNLHIGRWVHIKAAGTAACVTRSAFTC
jgi:hypothetical protein